MGPIASEFRKWQEWARRIKIDVQNRLVHPRQLFRGFVETVNAKFGTSQSTMATSLLDSCSDAMSHTLRWPSEAM